MKRIIAILLPLILMLTALSSAFAADAVSGADVQGVIDRLISYNIQSSGALNTQDWIDNALAADADGSGGWYIIALRQLGADYDLSRCRDSLEKAADECGEQSIIARLRISLTLLSTGSESGYITSAAQDFLQENQLMTLVYGLHLLNNGVCSDVCDRQSVVSRLLDMQHEDGGWSVIGQKSDVDSTAMTLQALAPLYGSDAQATSAIDRALDMLSACQLENGCYISMGAESPESCAQVMTALSSLGIDCAVDARFIKNGHTVIDAMLRYQTPDGGFSHELPAEHANPLATSQAFYSLAAYRHMQKGGGAFFVFDTPLARQYTAAGDSPAAHSGKRHAYAAIAIIAAALCAAAFVRKRREIRTYAFIIVAAGALALLVSLINIQSPEDYYSSARQTEGDTATYITIRCDSVAGMNQYTPADGIILSRTQISVGSNATAFDQLIAATKQYHIQLEYSGSPESAYVSGISYIYESDFGELSGWQYMVNGEFASVGCGQYSLKENDEIVWIYTTELGRDITGN